MLKYLSVVVYLQGSSVAFDADPAWLSVLVGVARDAGLEDWARPEDFHLLLGWRVSCRVHALPQVP